MRRKRPNYEQQQASIRWQEFSNARLMRDIDPTVTCLRIEMEFIDPDMWRKPSSRTYSFTPDRPGYFKIECAQGECMYGGFDLTTAVREAIRNKTGEISGKFMCMGWQDRERINKHRCLFECHYRIIVAYTEI